MDISGPTIQNPDIVRLLLPLLDRLDREYPSFESYLQKMRGVPFVADAWTDELLDYCRADVEERAWSSPPRCRPTTASTGPPTS